MQGRADAQCNLGWMHEKDYATAIDWYNKQGRAYAQTKLDRMQKALCKNNNKEV